MANGRLGAVDLSANVDTTVFTVTSATVASFSISLCNRNASSARVRLALSASATPRRMRAGIASSPRPGMPSIAAPTRANTTM